MAARTLLALWLLWLWPCSLSVTPLVQTNVYKGQPEKWANGIDHDPFVKIGNNYYYFELKQKLNWYEALHACVRRKAQLIAIEDLAEWNPLIDYIKAKWNETFWTSGNDLGQPGTYYWMATGEKISWINHVEHADEDCTSLRENNDKTKWTTFYTNCANKNSYICEASTPTTIALTIF